MKEVKKCSISGIAFTMEADAYAVLVQYLESLNGTYGTTDAGREIVEDIEARIAELILSQQDNSRVVGLALVERIIAQMGTPEAIRDQEGAEPPRSEGRIPRRLYRDMEQARLGGVCAGVAKYFGTSPAWIRLAMFLPLVLLLCAWLPFFGWMAPLMGNLLGVFVICYLIMWFSVPAARTPRQKLEQNGQQITVRSIEEVSAAGHDVDAEARPVVAKAVYVFGQMVLGVFKLLAGLLVFGLILGACGLIIGLFTVGMAGPELLDIDAGIWTVSLGIMIGLIPILSLIYVLMCLIVSRKPNKRVLLVTFLVWILFIVATGVSAVHDGMQKHKWYEIRQSRRCDPDMELPECSDGSFVTPGIPVQDIRVESIETETSVVSGEQDD